MQLLLAGGPEVARLRCTTGNEVLDVVEDHVAIESGNFRILLPLVTAIERMVRRLEGIKQISY